MKILYFGAYHSADQRNSILMQGLRQNGVEIIECQDDSPGIQKFMKLFLKHWGLRKEYDVIFVGFLGHILMPLVMLINSPLISWRPRRPVVLDGFMSLYDSNIHGRQAYKPRSFKGYYYWLIDWTAFHLADLVLFDTEQHISFISREFGIEPERMARVLAGAREDIFRPLPPRPTDGRFNVVFHGTFIRSQGIEFILQAAKKVEGNRGIVFTFIGNGQVGDEMRRLANELALENVTFLGRLPPKDLTEQIAQADVCLGLFGRADKIQRVIATKVYECIAMRKPVITGEAPAVRELFGDNAIFFVNIADADSLAAGILRLWSDPALRESLAKNAHAIFKERASTEAIGRELRNLLVGLQTPQ